MYDEKEALYAPIVEEIRVSPVVSRKGYLNILEEKTSGWRKQWVVSEFIFLLSSVSFSLCYLCHFPTVTCVIFLVSLYNCPCVICVIFLVLFL